MWCNNMQSRRAGGLRHGVQAETGQGAAGPEDERAAAQGQERSRRISVNDAPDYRADLEEREQSAKRGRFDEADAKKKLQAQARLSSHWRLATHRRSTASATRTRGTCWCGCGMQGSRLDAGQEEQQKLRLYMVQQGLAAQAQRHEPGASLQARSSHQRRTAHRCRSAGTSRRAPPTMAATRTRRCCASSRRHIYRRCR